MIAFLNNRSLLKVSGPDASIFLQSQFSNNINGLKDNQLQVNAFCQHQGKIIALLWVIRQENIYYLSIPESLTDTVLSRLNMFKLMSKIQIEDVSADIYQYGLINTQSNDSMILKNTLSVLLSNKQIKTTVDNNLWDLVCINHKIPEIYQFTSEKHIPQALNLDVDEFGVSFSKGCYPGQEVVARMHYLGKPKRRLFHFSAKCNVLVGDELNVGGSISLKSSGEVVKVAREKNTCHFLATFEIKHINDQIFLNNDQDKILNIINDQ